MTIVAISGYFDPLHVGHLEYVRLARELGKERAGEQGVRVVAIVNNDAQAKRKKGYSFMDEADRVDIMQSLAHIDRAVLSIDNDQTVRESLRMIKPDIFANGGDRHNHEIPEAEVCRELGIEIVDGLGEKVRSSSELVEHSRARVEDRAA